MIFEPKSSLSWLDPGGIDRHLLCRPFARGHGFVSARLDAPGVNQASGLNADFLQLAVVAI